MKLTFISNNWADAHQQTRLQALMKSGVLVDSLAVFRDYYPVNSEILPEPVGKLDHGSYSKRISTYLLLFCKLMRHVKGKQTVYVFGFDLVLIAVLVKVLSPRKIIIIYEVPDIRELFFAPGLCARILRLSEKILIPKIDLLIATSPEFVSEYYIKLRKLNMPDFRVIENKIHFNQLPAQYKKRSERRSGKIRVGYFGVLRCRASLSCLMLLAAQGTFEIILRGIFMPATSDFQNQISEICNITYLGPYSAPEDLPGIYDMVDIVWAAYPYSGNTIGNHLWAKTNRFYESLYFQKPFIVQKGTSDARQARQLGNIAMEIDLEDANQVIEQICLHLKFDYILSAEKAIRDVPEHYYQITTEYENLLTCLQQKII